jgi:hypothetical protein
MSNSTEPGPEPASKPNPVDLSFLIHTIPDIPSDAIILGLCTVASNGNDGKLSAAQEWYLSAFAAWKTLLRTAFPKNTQTWLSGTDGWIYSPLYFGGKCVDKAFDDQDVKVFDDPHYLATAFLLEILKKTNAAAGRKPIVVIVCGPTGLGQDIPFGPDPARNPQATVTVKDIQVNSKGVKQLMLVTPSMLAATWWLVNPHINQKASTAAASHIPPNTGTTPLTTTNLVKMYARRCTLMFMDQLIPEVLSERSLFLHPKHEGQDNATAFDISLRTDTAQQTAAALVSQAARQALYNNVAPYPVEDGFFFFPKADPWGTTIRSRKGFALSVYEKLWDRLSNAPEPSATAFPHGFGHSASSGSTTLDKSKTGPERLRVNLETGKHRSSAASFHWDNKKHKEAAYQLAAMSLADAVVLFSKLEQPQGQPCIRWNPSTDESILLANAAERKCFKEFIRQICECRIFRNRHAGKKNFGLAGDFIMLPDDAAALIELYSHPVMYMWQAFKLKQNDIIQKMSGLKWDTEAQGILNGLPEVVNGKILHLLSGFWHKS